MGMSLEKAGRAVRYFFHLLASMDDDHEPTEFDPRPVLDNDRLAENREYSRQRETMWDDLKTDRDRRGHGWG